MIAWLKDFKEQAAKRSNIVLLDVETTERMEDAVELLAVDETGIVVRTDSDTNPMIYSWSTIHALGEVREAERHE